MDIRSLKQSIRLTQLIAVLIQESDYRKKLVETEPLTFGDKYSDYHQILVFGIDQSKRDSFTNVQSC